MDVGILDDIAVVIVVDERMAVDRVVQDQRRNDHQKTQNYIVLLGR